MDIEEVLAVWDSCRNGRLNKISDDFYDRIKKRIYELEEMKKNAEEEEFLRIEDEIRTLKRLQKKIFEARTGRVLRLAWAKVCGNEVEGIENMTKDEKNLFEKIIEILEKFKRIVLERIEEREEECVLVRIKRDVPEFKGVDGRVYKLSKEDIVMLPALNAKALIENKLAEEIKVQ